MQQLAISAKVRAVLYTVFGVVGVAVGATQVAYSAAHLAQPGWLTTVIEVVVFLTGAFGYTAASHVDTAPVTARLPVVVAAAVGPVPVVPAGPAWAEPAPVGPAWVDPAPVAPTDPVILPTPAV